MVALNSRGEAQRNQLLRRVDWRFLAGKPHPRRVWVPKGGMLAHALALVAERMLEPDQAVLGSADLVAVINPRSSELKQAWQVLEPGGTLYGEWYLPRPGGPGALRQRLANLGFLIAGIYWPWPWPERATPAFWLPLEAPHALSYFLENRPAERSLLKQGLRSGLKVAWRLGYRLGLLAPVCIVAHKPLTAGSSAELPPNSLPARATRWNMTQNGARLDWLLLTGGLHSTNKVTGLVFQNGADNPSFVVKMPRRKLSLPALTHEAEVLEVVHSFGARPLPGVPELVFLNTQDGFPAIGETHLDGVPLYTVMQSGNLKTLARQATRWLLRLVDPGPPVPPEAWWERLVTPVLDDFEHGYAAVGGRAILDAARAELTHLGPLPMAIEHRDFSPWNVLFTSSGGLSVLDWEGAELNGLPFSDLFYFLTYLTFFSEGALENGAMSAAYHQIRAPHTRMGSISAACIQEYCAGAGLSVKSLRPLRLLTWLRHAVLEHKLIANSSTGQPDPKLLERGLYLSLVRTELELNTNG